MQVARVGIEQPGLTGQCFDDLGMRMPEMADVVEAIEIGPAVIVDQPDAIATDELDRLGIGDRKIGQQQFLALGDQFLSRPAMLRERFGRQAGESRRVRENFGPYVEIGGFTDA